MITILQQICAENSLKYVNSSPVSGGDINQAYTLQTNQGRFFLKVNDAGKFPGMFAKEAVGLNALRGATTLLVPAVKAYGSINGHQYLLLEWMQKASPATGIWEKLAKGLAELHRTTHKSFGFKTANYIGSLPQDNSLASCWGEFYYNCRLLPLLIRLYNSGHINKSSLTLAGKLHNRLLQVFPNEQPSLLHGDLWSGNFMVVNHEGETVPCIYDPAIYYGHREMDIGMTLLFGGFSQTFYEVYDHTFPLGPGWPARVSLTQLYPVLVHAVLFGGGYIQRCLGIIKHWA